MSKPGGEAPDAGKPQLYDTAPPRSTGVPVERNPLSGKPFTGDPLGPNGQGGYWFLDWFASQQRRSGLQLALERRSNDQYAFVPEPHFGFRKIAVQPKEWRGRVVGNWQVLPDRRQVGALLQFGYERVRNFNFAYGDDRNGFLARASLQYRFF